MAKPHFRNVLVLAMTVAMSVPAFAEIDPPGVITVVAARYPEALERRIDEALAGTSATLDQKIEIVGILEAALHDVQPLRAQRATTDTALREAMSADKVDPAMIERLRRQQIQAVDTMSKRMTQAMTDAGKVLDTAQRQAFHRNWSERPFARRS